MNDELIHVAWVPLNADFEGLAQDRARRAVSTAYHALFHALAASNADMLVGADSPDQNWVRVYRALDHRGAGTVLERLPRDTTQRPLLIFAAAFVELQEKRHAADCDPGPFELESASVLVLQAAQANHQFKTISPLGRHDLAIKLLFRSRL